MSNPCFEGMLLDNQGIHSSPLLLPCYPALFLEMGICSRHAPSIEYGQTYSVISLWMLCRVHMLWVGKVSSEICAAATCREQACMVVG